MVVKPKHVGSILMWILM